MPPALVLDASVPLAWSLPDEGGQDPARGILAALGQHAALVPAHWRAEVGNGLLMAARRGRLDGERLPRILAELSTLAVEIDTAGAEDAWSAPLGLALATGLTLYDALYLELAVRRALPLASFDAALRRAAQRSGVPILP